MKGHLIESNVNAKTTIRKTIVVPLIAVGILGIILMPLWIYFSIFRSGLSVDQNDWGNFGAYVGGTVGTLFAFLTLVALIAALWLQRQEIRHYQKTEQVRKQETQRAERIRDLVYVLEALGHQVESKREYIDRHIKSVSSAAIEAYPGFVEVVSLIKQMSKFQLELYGIDPQSRVFSFYSVRYRSLVSALVVAGLVMNREVKGFFKEF